MNIIEGSSILGKKVIFENILEDIPGGVSLLVATRLDYSTAGKEYLPAGTPVYVDVAARTAQVCKTTESAVAIDATHLFVKKNHHFKVGDSISDFINNRIISAISASGTTHEILTVPSGLVITAGTDYAEAATGAASAYAASAASQATLYLPNGLTKDDVYVVNGNADVAIVKMGTVRGDALDNPLPDAFKVSLRGGILGTGTSLITVV